MNNLQNLPDLGNTVAIDGDTGRDYAQFLGGTREFEHIDRATSTMGPRKIENGAWITAVWLKNASGGALVAGNLARLDVSGTAGTGKDYLYTQVVGYGNADYLRSVVLIDPWISGGSVADGYGFWGIIKGPAPGRTPQAAGTFLGAVTQGLPVLCTADALGRISGPPTTPASATIAMKVAYGVLGTASDSAATSDTSHTTYVTWNIPIFG